MNSPSSRIAGLLLIIPLAAGFGLLAVKTLREVRQDPEKEPRRSSTPVPSTASMATGASDAVSVTSSDMFAETEDEEAQEIVSDPSGLRAAKPVRPSDSLRTGARPTRNVPKVVYSGEVERDLEDGALIATLSDESDKSIRFTDNDVSRVEAEANGKRNLVLRNGTRVRLTDELLEQAPSLAPKATYRRR